MIMMWVKKAGILQENEKRVDKNNTTNHLDEVEQLKCPNCGKHEIEYIYWG